ncbi:MAG: 50S ribosomal protein L17 [Candidatus Saccharimonadales bacterium]|nr:50S ribosomal protein L17 [Candidatus Saccharimonadales bacterium]
MPSRGTAAKKLSRKRDQRSALLRGLARSVVLDGSAKTTKTKAKAVHPLLEKLATKAKVDSLHSRRQIISALGDVEATDALIERMAGSKRPGGHLRIEKEEELRRGDGAEMATISFVDEPGQQTTKKAPTETPKAKKAAESRADEKPDSKGDDK